MDRRRFLAITIPSVVLLAACGGDDTPSGSPVDTTPAGSDAPQATDAPAGIQHPTGAEEVVVRYGSEGGFVPTGFAFMNLPTVLITGDGRVIQPGVIPAIYPGPLVRPLRERSITEAGIQEILEIADANDLLQEPPKYARNDMLADAPDTVVALQAKGGSFVHRAYALGFDTETDPDRQKLAAFTAAMDDIDTAAGPENLGADAEFTAAAYRIMAMPTDIANWEGNDPAPEQRRWPKDAPVRLADAAQCAQLDAAVADPIFADATELTFFTDEGQLYQVFVAPLLPGDATC